MKVASAQLQAYLAAARLSDAPMTMADCFTITLATSATMHFTNIDRDVVFAGATFQANAVLIDGLKYKTETGLSVDKQQITIAAWPTQTLNGAPFLMAVAGGAFDGAHVKRYRVFLDPSLPGGADGVLLFQGRVSTVDSVGRTQAKITIASDLAVLEYDMPHNLFGPTCSHVLYDQGCGANRASFTFAGSVGAGSSQTQINWAGAVAGIAQGSLKCRAGSTPEFKPPSAASTPACRWSCSTRCRIPLQLATCSPPSLAATTRSRPARRSSTTSFTFAASRSFPRSS